MSADPGAGVAASALVVERWGPHVLIRHRDEVPWERSVLTARLVPAGEAVLLATAAAHRAPSLPGLLPSVLAGMLAPGVRRVWLAVSGAGEWGDWLSRLAEWSGVEILAPSGSLVVVPGGTLFVVTRGRGFGWVWYRAGTPGVLATASLPVPQWEGVLPRQPLAAAGLVAEPVPAGLAVREAGAPPLTGDDPTFVVPVDAQRPKLVLDRPFAPEAVAVLLGQLPPAVRGALLVVCAAGSGWSAALADAVGHDVLASHGMQVVDQTGARQTIVFADGDQVFRPFATVSRYRPGVSTVEVVDIALPPRGWSRCGPRHYRPDDAGSPVRAEVTASGLRLWLDGAAAPPVDPPGPALWTITLGSPGERVTDPLLGGLERLVAGLAPDQLRTVRIQVAGTVGSTEDLRLLDLADATGVSIELPKPDGRPESGTTERMAVPEADTESIPAPARPTLLPEALLGGLDQLRPVTESAAPGSRSGVVPPTRAEPVRRPVSPPTSAELRPAATRDGRPATPRPPAPEPQPAAAPAGAPENAEPVHLTGTRIEDRSSSAAEQDQFGREAGGEFNEALAIVNAALATWPALRVLAGDAQDRATKVDFVAVCLYLGEGGHGAVALNTALRAGTADAQRAHLPCLVSGLRRLPLHRRPVLRQARIGAGARRWYPAGLVVTEPGFLSASVATDVAVAGADVDFLIWPRSARRTSALTRDRPFAEAVFFAGSRFRVLAVRTVDHDSGDQHRPAVTVLMRELLPDDDEATTEAADREVLSKLDQVLTERHSTALRVLDDPDVSRRLAGTPVGLDEPVAPQLAQTGG